MLCISYMEGCFIWHDIWGHSERYLHRAYLYLFFMNWVFCEALNWRSWNMEIRKRWKDLWGMCCIRKVKPWFQARLPWSLSPAACSPLHLASSWCLFLWSGFLTTPADTFFFYHLVVKQFHEDIFWFIESHKSVLEGLCVLSRSVVSDSLRPFGL